MLLLCPAPVNSEQSHDRLEALHVSVCLLSAFQHHLFSTVGFGGVFFLLAARCVGRLIHHFGAHWYTSTTIKFIFITYGAEINVTQRMGIMKMGIKKMASWLWWDTDISSSANMSLAFAVLSEMSLWGASPYKLVQKFLFSSGWIVIIFVTENTSKPGQVMGCRGGHVVVTPT